MLPGRTHARQHNKLDDHETLPTKNKVLIMNKLLIVVLAIFLPPISVFIKSGAGKDLIINILLCLLFFIPGVVHALWISVR